MLGNKPQWPGLHLFYLVSDDLASDREINGIVFGDRSVQWTAPSFVASARKLAQWNASGYIAAGANSMSPADALAKFVRGTGVFLPAGSWNAAELSAAMGDNVAFFLTPPVRKGDPRRATGSVGYGWHITAASRQPDLAAEFIDFMTQEAFAIQLAAERRHLTARPGRRRAPDAFATGRRNLRGLAKRPRRTGRCCRISISRRRTGPKSSIRPCSRSSRGRRQPERGLALIEQSREKFLDSL